MHYSAVTAIILGLLGIATPLAVVAAQTAPDVADGHTLYTANCSACHQAAGQGMPNMAPALKDNPIVAGDSAPLIQILLKGPAAVLPADRPHFGSSTMDSFYYRLNDDQVAAVLTYVRQQFGKDPKAAPVDAKDVAAARAKIDPNTLGN
jgi:mono/diheme cytochrome c family protein